MPFELPSTIPTMISAEERRYLHWLGREFWTARGEVVEIGPWLGGSTYSLATGMAAHRSKAHRRLHVFDSFIWLPFMSHRAPLPLKPGDNFQTFFERNLEPYRELLVVNCKTLPDDRSTGGSLAVLADRKDVAESDRLRWNDGPIEILFIDGAKSQGGLLYLLKETAASLVPRQSLMVCQDYKHRGSYKLPAFVELLSDHFRLVHLLDQNTVSSACIRPTDPNQIHKLADYESLSPARGAAVLESAARHLEAHGDPGGAVLIRLAKAGYLAQRGAAEQAIPEFREVERVSLPRQHSRAVHDTLRWLETLLEVRLVPSAWFRARCKVYWFLRYGAHLYAQAKRLVGAQAVVQEAP